MHLYLDHIIIAVRDLEQAVQDYHHLGFTIIRGGVHANGATQNALIAFEDGTYLELLAPTGAEPIPNLIDFSVLLQQGEGLVGYALRTENIEAEAARLQYNGLEVGDIISGRRHRPDGTLVEWKLFPVEGGFAPFLIQDISLTQFRIPNDLESTTHVNGAIGLAQLEIAVHSLSDSCERYTKLLGLTQRDLDLAYARGFELKTGVLWLMKANPENLNFDWEAHYRKQSYYSDALQKSDPNLNSPTLASMRESGKRMLESMQAHQRRDAEIWFALSEGKKAEALFSLHIAFDNAPNDSFTLDKTHGVHITQRTGVSKRRSLPVFEKMDQVDWSQVSHAYGHATDTPANIRALASNNEVVRHGAIDALTSSIIHQGTVYSATLTALPFLIELLNVPEVPDKHHLLDLIMSCGRYDVRSDQPDSEVLSEDQRHYRDLKQSLWQVFRSGIPTYHELMEHPDARVRHNAISVLSEFEQEQENVESTILAQCMTEIDPIIRADLIQSLVYLWLPNAESHHPSVLRADRAELLAGWLHDTNEPPAVRFRAAVNLLRFSGSEWLDEVAAMLDEVMQTDSATLATLGQRYMNIFFDVQGAFAKYPDRLLEWLNAQAKHALPEIRAEVPFTLNHLASLRRSAAESIAPILITLAHDPSVEVRFKAIIYMGSIIQASGIRDMLQELALHEPSLPLRERAAAELTKSRTFGSPKVNYRVVNLTIEEMIAKLQAAKTTGDSSLAQSDLPQLFFALGKQGQAASQAVPYLKYWLTKPVHNGRIYLEALRALWRIQPDDVGEVLPTLLPLITFSTATAGLFHLFGEMGALAEPALPLMKRYVESDLRGGGLPGTGNFSSVIDLDETIKAVAQQSIKQIEDKLASNH